MVTIDIEDNVIDIDDLGVTLRTLMAVAATGYAQTDRRKWSVRYKKVLIASVQVASNLKPKSREGAYVAFAEVENTVLTTPVQVADVSNFRPGSLQASLALVGLVVSAEKA